MRPDTHTDGRYTVNNIYFDDMYLNFYNDKQAGAYIRDKYRLRFYNNDMSFIRLERKHKEGFLTSKTSIIITQDQLYAMQNGDFYGIKINSPLWEEFMNIHRLRRLRPVVSFSYQRQAYIHTSGDVRVTFDNGIARGLPGVLEVKYSGFMPLFIKELLDRVPMAQTEMSKYCAVFDINRRYNLNDNPARTAL